jgi:hypothetical protein
MASYYEMPSSARSGCYGEERREPSPRRALIELLLFNMTPNDPRTLAVSAATLLAVAVPAGHGRTRGALRIDPMIALRHERTSGARMLEEAAAGKLHLGC